MRIVITGASGKAGQATLRHYASSETTLGLPFDEVRYVPGTA